MRLLCKIYRSSRHEGMYLYVDAQGGLECVPDDLMRRFGAPVEAMRLMLTPQKKLARADASEVISLIADAGYYLQLPPSAVSNMHGITIRNDKLPR
jgi:uncharacterized protein YcgL (UPF0745 family)